MKFGNKTYLISELWTNPIIQEIRLPRFLASIFAASLMGISGQLMQIMTQNPIAESSTLGIASGASLFLSILMALGLGTGLVSSLIFGVLGAFCSLCLVWLLTLRSAFQPIKILLVGTSLGMFCSGLASGIAYYGNSSQRFFMWTVGSFSAVSKEKTLLLGLCFFVVLGVCFLFSRQIKLLSFGEELATSLGLDVIKMRWVLVLLIALSSGVVVSTVGVLGFLGLMMPHMARRLAGASFVKTLWLNILLSSVFLSLADLLARTLFLPYELPVGALTMLLGAPFFLYLVGQVDRGIRR